MNLQDTLLLYKGRYNFTSHVKTLQNNLKFPTYVINLKEN